eukprot:scaffold351779_cov17-Prasinocladus_malaysianus.AAC.1
MAVLVLVRVVLVLYSYWCPACPKYRMNTHPHGALATWSSASRHTLGTFSPGSPRDAGHHMAALLSSSESLENLCDT